ncbi:MAG: Flp pilus assembly complex ATPase component TadA [Alphaproteobacteria bacterium]|nr:Flp pilus assembly complex ATPase component TadA [Alphaproteobacteria bacterium]
MAEEVKAEKKKVTQETPTSNFEMDESEKEASQQTKKPNLFERLFANGNRLITLSGASDIVISNETRRLLALFSDGTYLVSKDNRFDGAVYNFEANVKRRKIPIKAATYVTLNEIAAIYAYAERGGGTVDVSAEEAADMQMQIDFINIIQRASQKKVSDIHVVVGSSSTILFREGGIMIKQSEYGGDWGEAFVRSVFASADISDSNYNQNEFQGAQKLGATPLRGSNGKLMLPHNVLAIRLQFNPVAFGSQYLVMRLLYADDNPEGSSDLRSLGLGKYEEDLFFKMRSMAVGLNVVAGPTGSGKSTTLQRNMIKLLQEKDYKINLLTVEDPPEYPIPGARQMPVTNANTEEEKTEQFTKALSAALRSDPDVVLVGETRSLATAELTFKGALSGHGVWTTLHANSAPAIITRLRDMGIQPYMLNDPELVKGLVSQRLFSKLCPVCKQPIKTREGSPEFIRLNNALGEYGVENVYVAGPGCKACGYKGFKGRMAVDEIILPDSKFLRMIIDNETANAIDYWVSELNGRPLKDAAIERMIKGQIDLDEVERWCGLIDQRPVY